MIVADLCNQDNGDRRQDRYAAVFFFFFFLISYAGNISSVLSVSKCIIKQAKQIINKLVASRQFLSSDYTELSCTVWSLVMVRNRLPAQVVKGIRKSNAQDEASMLPGVS